MGARWRVEELARRADVSVDTIRFYQKRRLLPPPAREGRVAWYGPEHLERLARIRELQRQGLTLAADRSRARRRPRPDRRAARRRGRRAPTPRRPRSSSRSPSSPTGRACRAALLEAVAREGLLVPRVHDGDDALHDRRHRGRAAGPAPARDRASRSPICSRSPASTTTRRTTSPSRRSRCSTAYVRAPLRASDLTDDEKASDSSRRSATLLPAVTALVAHHFRRVLLAVAQEHLESVGEDHELAAASAEPGLGGGVLVADYLVTSAGGLPEARREGARRRGDVRPHRARATTCSTGSSRSAWTSRGGARTVACARPARGLARARPRVRHRRPVPRPRRTPATRADRRRLLGRDARRRADRRTARPRRRRGAPASPTARSTASRADSRSATSSTSDPSSPSAHACCGPAAASPCSTSPNPSDGSCARGTRCWFRASCRSSGAGSLATRDAYRYLPRSTAYLPPPERARSASCTHAGFAGAGAAHDDAGRLGAAHHRDTRRRDQRRGVRAGCGPSPATGRRRGRVRSRPPPVAGRRRRSRGCRRVRRGLRHRPATSPGCPPTRPASCWRRRRRRRRRPARHAGDADGCCRRSAALRTATRRATASSWFRRACSATATDGQRGPPRSARRPWRKSPRRLRHRPVSTRGAVDTR